MARAQGDGEGEGEDGGCSGRAGGAERRPCTQMHVHPLYFFMSPLFAHSQESTALCEATCLRLGARDGVHLHLPP